MTHASIARPSARSPSSRWLARSTALFALVLLPAAHAGYFNWDMVELPPESGASCGNGTPYRFFVNRTPLNHNVSLTFEGGGACWDQDACEGKGPYSASNPDGIPLDYMHSLQTMAAGGLVTPFTSRLDPFQKVRTQDWTMVYLPYCTGDVHVGSKVSVYDDVDPSAPRVQHHAGLANIRAAASWLRTNLGRADDLLVGGFSAGGVGSTVNYATVRDTLAPKGKSTLLADSGPLFNAPRASTTSSAQYPSLPLHQKIRPAWGLDEPGGMIPRLVARLPALDVNNLGSLNTALARAYPQDRFGYLAFETDNVFSGFSYLDFHPEVHSSDPELQKHLVNQLWRTDLANWLPTLAAEANVDYHVPFFRDFNDAHCLSIVDFSGTGVEELGVASVLPFFDNLMDRGPAQRNYETDQVSDLSQTLSPIIQLLNWLENLFA